MNSFSAFEMKTLPFYLILCYFYLPSINSKTCVTTISQNIDTLISYPTNISYNFLTFYRRLSFFFHEFAIYKNSCTIEFLIDWRKSFLSYLFIIIKHFLTQYLIDKMIVFNDKLFWASNIHLICFQLYFDNSIPTIFLCQMGKALKINSCKCFIESI